MSSRACSVWRGEGGREGEGEREGGRLQIKHSWAKGCTFDTMLSGDTRVNSTYCV